MSQHSQNQDQDIPQRKPDLDQGSGTLPERPEAEEGLEGRHRGAAAVVAEDELVEVDLQVGIADAAVGAVHPRL